MEFLCTVKGSRQLTWKQKKSDNFESCRSLHKILRPTRLSSAHHLFSLLHHLLVALLEFTHLTRLLGILLHPLVELLLVDDEAEAIGLSYGNDVADQVVVAQSARVVVEPEEQH